jgi:hypothetical protein
VLREQLPAVGTQVTTSISIVLHIYVYKCRKPKALLRNDVGTNLGLFEALGDLFGHEQRLTWLEIWTLNGIISIDTLAFSINVFVREPGGRKK